MSSPTPTSVRIDPELLRRLDVFVGAQKVTGIKSTRTDIINEALKSFLDKNEAPTQRAASSLLKKTTTG